MSVNVSARPQQATPPSPPHRSPRAGVPAIRLGRFDLKAAPYFFISPFFILFGIFGAFPIVFTVYVSLHDWRLLGGNKGFVGLENYRRADRRRACSGTRWATRSACSFSPPFRSCCWR